MKKKMIKLLIALGASMCVLSMQFAVYASEIICFGKFYQPELPDDIADFKARHMAK